MDQLLPVAGGGLGLSSRRPSRRRRTFPLRQSAAPSKVPVRSERALKPWQNGDISKDEIEAARRLLGRKSHTLYVSTHSLQASLIGKTWIPDDHRVSYLTSL